MTNFRTLAPAASVLLFVGYSILATLSGGALTGVAAPLLIAAIALAVWHDRTGATVAA